MKTTLPTTFWELVVGAADDRPEAPVVSDDHGRALTRAQLRDTAETAAAALLGLGVNPDTIVSWQLPTTIESVVLLAALARIGAVQNPLIPMLREREVSFVTRQVRTELLVVPEEWRGFRHGDMARDLARQSGFDVLEIDLAELGARESPTAIRLPVGDPAVLAPSPSLDGPRWIYYSSGTTADPKGARHTDFSIMSSANGLLDLMGLGETDVYPIPWPITHIGGASVLASSLRGGVHLLLFENFDPTETPVRMAAHQPTVLGTAVPFFRAYLDAASRHGDESLFPSLRLGCFGGAPVPNEIHDEMRSTFDVPLVGSWGLTEFPNATSAAPSDSVEIVTTSVGRPARDVAVRATDANGDVCGTGEEGELVLRGPQCFSGYVDATLNDSSIDADGWFHTGDLGTIDAAGNVRVTGRIKDIIIRNAENISVIEVEDLLYRNPAVADAAVVGVPDQRTGERVVAFVVLRDGSDVGLAEIRQHCRRQGLAVQKCPEQLEVVEAIPRNAMGKVLKQDLRARLA
ncbi:MAG TPA: AMP-binding protein [Acidimicrobiales bacterium]|nr:AMP-binding protein [Acidimicrobiales bacterium]